MLQPAVASNVSNVPPEDHEVLWSAVMLDWLGQEPVAFHRSFVEIAGNVVAALWLSYILHPAHRIAPPAGVPQDPERAIVVLDVPRCTRDTGLTREDQHAAWKAAEDLGLLLRWPVESDELPHGGINLRRLADLILQHSQETAEALRQAQSDRGVVLAFDPDVLDAKARRRAEERAARLERAKQAQAVHGADSGTRATTKPRARRASAPSGRR